MKTVTLIICDRCGNSIKANKGKIIKGKIYTITKNISERKIILGNNYQELSEDTYELAYCNDCLKKLLFSGDNENIANLYK